jgi:hypothetical protein
MARGDEYWIVRWVYSLSLREGIKYLSHFERRRYTDCT